MASLWCDCRKARERWICGRWGVRGRREDILAESDSDDIRGLLKERGATKKEGGGGGGCLVF